MAILVNVKNEVYNRIFGKNMNFQGYLSRFNILGSRTRLRPRNSFVGVIFDAYENDHTIIKFFGKFQ